MNCGNRFCRRDADQHAADQPWPGRRRNAGEGVKIEPGLFHCGGNDAVQNRDMGAGSDLGHDAAVGRVVLDLAEHDIGQNLRPCIRGSAQAHDSGRGFVAARLDA